MSFSILVLRYELFFPLQGLEGLRAEIPENKGKNYKIPLPGPTPEYRVKLQKNCENYIFRSKFTPFLLATLRKLPANF